MQLGVVLYALFFFFFFFRSTVLIIKGIRGGLRESILSQIRRHPPYPGSRPRYPGVVRAPCSLLFMLRVHWWAL